MSSGRTYLKWIGTLAAIGAVVGLVVAFRLMRHDASLHTQRAALVEDCNADEACLDAIEAHFAPCHEGLYDYQTYGGRQDSRHAFQHGDAPDEVDLDPAALRACIAERSDHYPPR